MLAAGAGVGLLAMATLTPWTVSALGTLAEARADQATLAAAAIAPEEGAIVSPGLALAAPSRDAAAGVLAAQVRVLAARGGVLVEGMETVSGGGLARMSVRLSGSEGAVLGLADGLERGTPLVRFARWRVEASGGSVRLTGELVAPWG